jgi:hypothetical protein
MCRASHASGSAEVLHITYTEEDVRTMAREAGVDGDAAVALAHEWGKHIADTASRVCDEQLREFAVEGVAAAD